METRLKNQNEEQETTKSMSDAHFHSLAQILDQWKVANKNHKENRKSTNGQRKATRRATKTKTSNK